MPNFLGVDVQSGNPDIKEAREWLKSNNPFLKAAVKSVDGAPTTTAVNSALPRSW